MDELIRSKMHDALEGEQPDPGMRSRILSSLPADDRVGRAPKRGTFPMARRTEFVAAIAAVVIAALVVGSFVYVRAITRTHTVVPNPSPSGNPQQPPNVTQPLNVDPNTPVLLFNDWGNKSQVNGMTWDGRVGKLVDVPKSGQYSQSGAASNPAGTLFVAFPNILDRTGKVVATLTGSPYTDPGVGAYFVGTWADDNLHYCQVIPIFGGGRDVPGTLQLTTPGGTPRNVVQIGLQSAGARVLTVSVCSVQGDRAVVIQADPSPVTYPAPLLQYWVVKLSTGQILWTRDLRGKGITSAVASRDGRYVAEIEPTGATTIYGGSGSAVGHVSGDVQTFSWDGSLVLVVASGGQASVVRWSESRAIWSVPADDGLGAFQTQPGGTNLAIVTINSVLYVVAPSGRVVAQRQMRSDALLACQACVRPSGTGGMQLLPRILVGKVGWSDGLQRTTDGGLHWRYVSPPNPPNRTKGGNTTYVFDVDHAWATAAAGDVALRNATKLMIFATADGGQTWSQASVPLSGVVTSTAIFGFIDTQHGWLVVDSGRITFDKSNTTIASQPLTRTVYVTTNGGGNWSRLASAQEGDGSALGTLALGCFMSGLTFANPDRGLLTWDCNSRMGEVTPVTTSVVAATTDGGRTWKAVELPSFPTGADLICGASRPVFTQSLGVIPMLCAGGFGHPGFNAVYATNDLGRSWSFDKVPFFTQRMTFVDGSTGWAFGPDMELYRTVDAGSSWQVVKGFAPEQNVLGLSFVDIKTGFVLTSRFAADGNSGYSTMWKTTDGGQTWSVMSTRPTGPKGMFP